MITINERNTGCSSLGPTPSRLAISTIYRWHHQKYFTAHLAFFQTIVTQHNPSSLSNRAPQTLHNQVSLHHIHITIITNLCYSSQITVTPRFRLLRPRTALRLRIELHTEHVRHAHRALIPSGCVLPLVQL